MKRLTLLPLFCALIASSPMRADTTDNSQRELFKTTLAAAESGDIAQTDNGLQGLSNYPLKPYILYARLKQQLNTLDLAAVQAFSRQYPNTPLEGRLRYAMTTELGKRQQWKAFDTLYAGINNPSTEQQCYKGQSLLAHKKTKQAFSLAARLWRAGHSQPDVCDPLFQYWLKHGGLNDHIVEARVMAALNAGNPSLARYAARMAKGSTTKSRIQLAIQLYNQPKRLLTTPKLVTRHTANHRELLMLAVNRLRYRELDDAIQLWLRDRSRLAIPEAEQADITLRLALLKAKRFDDDARQQIAKLDPKFEYTRVTEWRIRLALSEQDWKQVSDLIAKLPPHERHKGRWRYWNSVALSHTGKDVSRALVSLSTERSFYGFLAAELSHRPFHLNHQPARFDKALIDKLASRPAFKRMAELYALGMLYDARSEWNLATQHLSDAEQYAASYLVDRWGWHNQAIRGAIQSEHWNDMQLRFPNPYPKLFDTAAEKVGIPSDWATAIARQESAFWVSARSRVGARGLMQLMPATARHTAKKHSLSLTHTADLYQPETNIRLGSAYLSDMYQRFDQNRVFATAAYNAGPRRVDSWLSQRGDLPLDIWIETIPFDETRNYVQNVLSFSVIYARLDKRPAHLLGDTERSMLALNQWRAGSQNTL